ncbi:MAG: ABC transporter permease [Candidatus Rokubacteria bacterium]|nr:ABC transporter permease [Candidatus Rokubacteria bacterium]
MLTYVRRRLLLTVPVVLGVSVIVFSIIHLLPGDPVLVILSGANATPEQVAEVRAQLRLDDPLAVQYLRFLRRALVGDFGRSIFSKRPVIDEIADQLPSTLQLAGTAILIAAAVGLALGIAAAVRHNTWIDRLAMLVALGGVSMPSFWLGLILILVFSLQLGWFPATGHGGVSRLVLPAATIGLGYSAVIARLVRSSLLDVLRNSYIATARAKGLSEGLVVLKHGVGNALIPVTTIIGVQLGNLLAGTIIVETVFSRQGMGRLAVTAVLDKDYPLIQGVVLVSALGYVLVNLLVDLSYSVLDPRIRHHESAA